MPLTIDEVEEIRAAQRARPGKGRYEKRRGKFARDLARRYGVSPRVIANVIAGRTFKTTKAERPLDPSERRRVLAAHDEGRTVKAIAAELGVLRWRVSHALMLGGRISRAEYHRRKALAASR